MTEGGAVRTKRNSARIFKNPPQPHMCIQDYLQGSDVPCYVNVLSWDKIAPCGNLSQTVPLYGGMRLSPPRGEKADIGVYAVLANPEVLTLYGKNAKDPKERSILIELLLSFVEKKQPELFFARQYMVLKDRDITGELKEVWMAVQAKRERENLAPQQETWIDAQPPAPQYPEYPDQQQQHQQQQQQQHSQHHQPPHYRPNDLYDEIRYDQMPFNCQIANVAPNDQMYQSKSIIMRPYRDDRSTVPAYLAAQYQFQQLPRQMVPQYVNSSIHLNAAGNHGMVGNKSTNPQMNQNVMHYRECMTMQPQVVDQRQMDNSMHANAHRIQQQLQQQHHQQNHQLQQQQQQPHMNYPVQPPQFTKTQLILEKIKKNTEKVKKIAGITGDDESSLETRNVQVTDLDEETKTMPTAVEFVEHSNKIVENLDYAAALTKKEVKLSPENGLVLVSPVQSLGLPIWKPALEPVKRRRNRRITHTTAGTYTPLARNRSRLDAEQAKDTETERLPRPEKDAEKQLIQNLTNMEPQLSFSGPQASQNDCVSKQKTDSPKRTQSTVNNIISSVFKMSPGNLGSTAAGKRKMNGLAKGSTKVKTNEQAEPFHEGYTILKKPEASTPNAASTVVASMEDLLSEFAEISIKDCKDTTKINAVLS